MAIKHMCKQCVPGTLSPPAPGNEASVVTAASAFAAIAVPPVVEPPVAQHEGVLKTKQNRLVKNIILGFRVPILDNSDSKCTLKLN